MLRLSGKRRNDSCRFVLKEWIYCVRKHQQRHPGFSFGLEQLCVVNRNPSMLVLPPSRTTVVFVGRNGEGMQSSIYIRAACMENKRRCPLEDGAGNWWCDRTVVLSRRLRHWKTRRSAARNGEYQTNSAGMKGKTQKAANGNASQRMPSTSTRDAVRMYRQCCAMLRYCAVVHVHMHLIAQTSFRQRYKLGANVFLAVEPVLNCSCSALQMHLAKAGHLCERRRIGAVYSQRPL